jgi:hypothetical protein
MRKRSELEPAQASLISKARLVVRLCWQEHMRCLDQPADGCLIGSRSFGEQTNKLPTGSATSASATPATSA